MDPKEKTLEILLEEYKNLKAEQNSRIGFRDNLLYVTLGLFGAIASIAITNDEADHAFLVIPWVCIVMGWTYVVNDEKISAIGRYTRNILETRISSLIEVSSNTEEIFGWETFHRSDDRRKSRKYIQLFVDLVSFVFSGLTALLVFWNLTSQPSKLIVLLCIIEALLLIGLGVKIIIYADLEKGSSATSPEKPTDQEI